VAGNRSQSLWPLRYLGQGGLDFLGPEKTQLAIVEQDAALAIADVVVDNCIHPGEGDQGGAFSLLTRREREVLQLLAEGKPTKQISPSLHISPRAVEVQRLRIMDKLRIDNIARLTKYAIQVTLTSPEV